MHRELIAQPHVASFSAFLLLAFVAGYLLARFNAIKSGIPPRHIDNQALLMIALSLVGARLFSWIFYFPAGSSFWAAMTAVGGGLVFYGGMVFAAAAALVYSLVARLSLRQVADLWAPPVALGLAIGRVGCFMAGCCWGDLCASSEKADGLTTLVRSQLYTIPTLSRAGFPLAVRFPPETGAYEQQQALGLIPPNASVSLPVHPAQLYEAAAVLALAFFLQRAFSRRERAGAVFGGLVLGYGIIRFLVEFVRADNPPIYWGFTLSQVISLCFVAGILLLRKRCFDSLIKAEVKSAPGALERVPPARDAAPLNKNGTSFSPCRLAN
jgi:phosphatidylglycerol:prolipoprotein diacylglycerol transferase